MIQRFSRILLHRVFKHYVGRKFRNAGRSIPRWRRTIAELAAFQSVPAGTEILPIHIDGLEAEWVLAPGASTERTVLYLHGGGFVMGSSASYHEMASYLSAAIDGRVLLLNYRLAPEHPFPAALDDAVRAFDWLQERGAPASRMAIAGDSAGGGLALQTLLFVKSRGWAQPAAGLLLSPFVEWRRFDGESYRTRARVDPYIYLEMCRFMASQYVGPNDQRTALLEPLEMDLSRIAPLCIHTGDLEVLLSDSTRLAESARAAGVDIELKVWPKLWHVFQLTPGVLPEAKRSLHEMAEFAAVRMASAAT